MVANCIECQDPAIPGKLGGTNLVRGLCPRCYSARLRKLSPPAECFNCGQVRKIVARGICNGCRKRARRQRECGQPVTVKLRDRAYVNPQTHQPKPVEPPRPATLEPPKPITEGRIVVHLPVAGCELWIIADPPENARQFEQVRDAIPRAGATLLRWAKARMLRGSTSRRTP